MRRNNNLEVNLILITLDQWRGDWGDPWEQIVSLPTIRKIAKKGWTARKCYTASPHCVPARFSWLTGLEPSQMGITRNEDVDLPSDCPSIVRKLKEKGWYTALIGKTHWTSHAKAKDLRDNESLIKKLGFDVVNEVAGPRALRRIECELTDEWKKNNVYEAHLSDLEIRYGKGQHKEAWKVRPSSLPVDLYPDIWIANKAIKQLDLMPLDKPWLLWISFVGPHEPFDTPEPWHGIHKDKHLPKPIEKPKWIKDLPKDNELYKLSEKWKAKLSHSEITNIRKDYADHLKLLDDQFAKIINKLNTREDMKKTAIVITSDHGELLGDAGMLYKGCFLESAIRVPFIYRPPPFFNIKRDSGKCYSRPLQLSGLLKETFLNLDNGGTIANIDSWSKKQKGAIVEFGTERLFIFGDRKIAFNKYGKPDWAVNISKDTDEQVNTIHKHAIRWRISVKWIYMRWWANRENRIRSERKWVWRQLRPNH